MGSLRRVFQSCDQLLQAFQQLGVANTQSGMNFAGQHLQALSHSKQVSRFRSRPIRDVEKMDILACGSARTAFNDVRRRGTAARLSCA
jgi:hypothetical protein